MELRQYFQIIWRRAWILVVITLVAAIASFVLSPKLQTSYVATMRLLISVPPELKTGDYYGYEKYYTWISSEYLVDDFAEVVKSAAFAEDIRKELGDAAVDVGAIAGERSTKKSHRALTVTFASKDPELVRRVAEATARVIDKRSGYYFAQLGYENAVSKVIDPPAIAPQVSGVRSTLDIALRTGLGFIAGMGIILLLDYLDTSIRDAGEAERLLGLPVLGEIPPEA